MRIVSLCPSITETLVALGAGPHLVGVTRFCVRPPDVTAGIAKVGGTKDPDLRAIRALRPDLVFANAEENRREDVEELAADFVVDLSHPRRAADVPPLLYRWGERVGSGETAREMSSKVREALGRAESARPSRPAFRALYLVWRNPWTVAGPGTYVADLIRLSGGSHSPEESPSGDPGDYPAVSEEEIAASRPDVLLLPDEPYPFGERDAAFWRERLPGTDVRRVPGDDWCWHGVRTLRGLAAAASLSAAVRTAA
ncbi:MAG TPA: helical backbone metal receptor [Thermoanaerobaculia bacterium]|nr:helical backbone metal receptor [Thermoanaerobaculia bacterium]